jgi:ATP-binding cassette subfamily F protein 3
LFRERCREKVKGTLRGERNRLALCKLFAAYQCLLMDEPTNHLDIKSKNVLKAALQNLEELLLVS